MSTETLPKIIINPELRDYMPAVSDSTTTELERQLLDTGGPLEPLAVWQETGFLLDGHRRYALCLKHKLPYTVRQISLSTMQDAKWWMDSWQYSRRNLTPQQQAQCLANLLSRERAIKKAGAIGRVAKAAGTSERSVYRAQKYTEALNSLPREIQAKLKSGEIGSSIREVLALAALPEMHQRTLFHNVETGLYATLALALFGDEVDDDVPMEEPARTDSVSVAKPEAAEAGEDEGLPSSGDESLPPREEPASVPAKASKHPAARPASDMAKDAQKLLGQLLRAIHDIHDAAPNEARKNACKRNLDYVGSALQLWWKEE